MAYYVLPAKERERADWHKGLSVNFACHHVWQALQTIPSPLLDTPSWTHHILPNGKGSLLTCADCGARR
jgi:hypothetical protein